MRWMIVAIILFLLFVLVKEQKTFATTILRGGVAGGSRQTGYGEGPITIPSEYRPSILRDAIIK